MASTLDKLLSIGKRGTLTTLMAPGKPIGADSLRLVQSINWPTDSKVAFSIRRVNIGGENDGKEIAGTYTEWTGILNAEDGNIDSLNLEQGTDQDYPPGTGTQVMIHISITVWEHLMAALRGIMNLDGTLKPDVYAPMYPVGSVYINATDNTNPATLFGFGTWIAFGAGRVPVGINSSDTDFDTAEETGGAKTHTLTAAQLPDHRHGMERINSSYGLNAGATGYAGNVVLNTGSSTAGQTGVNTGSSGQAHNNLQPYIVVYMWKRTA